MERGAVAESRQNQSDYLRHVAHGDLLQVTDGDQTFAMFVPAPADDDPLETLIAAGRATRPVGDLLDFGSPPQSDVTMPLAEALADLRGERLRAATSCIWSRQAS